MELGWPGYRELCDELKGLRLDAIAGQAEAFLDATDAAYTGMVEPALRETVGVGLGEARRSDLPRFFRFAQADGRFPGEALLPAYESTMAGLGIDVHAQDGIVLDVEPRPRKSPRAFCAPVRAPGEVYLVVPRPAGATTTWRCCTRAATRSTTAAWTPGWPSSSATWETTR